MELTSPYAPQTLAGKTILITGGTTGIGRATAQLMAGIGAKVFITGRLKKPLDQTIKDTLKMHPNATILGATTDLSDEKGIAKVFAMFEKEYGALDILINNAGLGAESVTTGEYKEWEYIIHTNLLSYMACANAAATIMKTHKKGHIVNVGSMSAETSEAGSSVYVASKAGIRGFSSSLRKEVNPTGIKVTLIEPGAVSTDMQPGDSAAHDKKIKKMVMLEAEDIAASIFYCLTQPERCNVISLQIRPLKQII